MNTNRKLVVRLVYIFVSLGIILNIIHFFYKITVILMVYIILFLPVFITLLIKLFHNMRNNGTSNKIIYTLAMISLSIAIVGLIIAEIIYINGFFQII